MQIERWHFWFVGRRLLIGQVLRRNLKDNESPVLDLGCGTGLMLENLVREGYGVLGLDIRPEGLYAAHEAVPSMVLLQGEAACLPFKENSFAGVLLLDVLEHTDDALVMAEVQRVLRPGGLVVISVPAMPWLWSYRDVAAGHLRRYTRKQLTRLIHVAKFRLQEIRYYQFFLLTVLVVTRLLGRRGPRLRDLEEKPLPALNSIMSWINRLEVRWSEILPWPWGSTLVAICRKGK
jgi:SAM-dependent methyltransferase